MSAVFIKTLGCKVNSYDTMAMQGNFAALGYTMASSVEAADLIIINTCSVTQNAEREARYLVRKLRRENPDALLVATGCYAQINPAELAAAGVDHVVPQDRKQDIVAIVDGLVRGESDEGADSCGKPLTLVPLKATGTRVYLRIQDGCESFCSYCIVPHARGRIRSVPPAAVLAEVQRLDAAGVREIVLTGIHLGQYGKDLDSAAAHGHGLAALVAELTLQALTHARLRLSSLEPMELTPRLLALVAAHPARLCPHFHLPLQSGGDRILGMMRRPYRAADYLAKVEEIRNLLPAVNLTTDVIVGFPTETDEEFAATSQLVAACGHSAVHVFPYSPRPGTDAALMAPRVDPAVIAARAAALREQAERQGAAYRASAVGSCLDLLWEESFDPCGRRIGRAQNYLEVVLEQPGHEARGTVTPVAIVAVDDDLLVGRPL